MRAAAHEIRTTLWARQDYLLRKDVILATDEGEFTFKLLFNAGRGPHDTPIPMTMLSLNFPLNPDHSQNDKWCWVRLMSGEEVGAAEAFRCTENDGQTMLVSVEKEVFASFSSALISEHDWHLEVLGTNGVMAECPLPNNQHFYSEFMALLEDAKKLNAAD